MSWPQIAVIIVASAVPFFIWGYKVGYRHAWHEVNTRAALMQSAVDKAWEDNHAEVERCERVA